MTACMQSIMIMMIQSTLDRLSDVVCDVSDGRDLFAISVTTNYGVVDIVVAVVHVQTTAPRARRSSGRGGLLSAELRSLSIVPPRECRAPSPIRMCSISPSRNRFVTTLRRYGPNISCASIVPSLAASHCVL